VQGCVNDDLRLMDCGKAGWYLECWLTDR